MRTLSTRRRCAARLDSWLGVMVDFWRGEQAQDLIEYSLLMSFLCLVGVAAYISMGQLTSSIWGIVNSRLAASNQSS